MSLQKQQDFLARLFIDEGLRQNFLSASEKIGAENGLNFLEIEDLKAVLPEEITFFAETLFWKRLRETEKVLPLTKDFLKDEFVQLFRDFAQNFNPQTVKKHLEDATEFCRFLQSADVSEIAKNIAKFEQTKIEFFGYGKHFAVCLLNYDIAEIARKSAKMKRKIYFWLRFGNKIKHFSL